MNKKHTPSSASPPAELRGRIAKDSAASDRQRINLLWPTWLAIIEALHHPDFELDAEDFGILYLTFSRLRQMGVRFDDAFCSAIEFLNRSVRNTDADPDEDNDDPDEDNDSDFSADLQGNWEPPAISSDECLARMMSRKALAITPPTGGGQC